MANIPAVTTKKSSFTRSLAFKVGFIAAMVMIVVLAIFSAVSIVSERQRAEQSILENGKTFADFSARNIYDQYTRFYVQPLPDDFVAFKERVESILSYNQDIQEVSLVSVNGRVLFDSQEFVDGKYSGPARNLTDKATLGALLLESTSTRELSNSNKRTTEVVVPLSETTGSHVLSMRYVLGYDSLGSRMVVIYQRVLAVAALLVLFVVITATFLAMRLTKPITQLIKVAEQIRGGNLAARAEVNSGDETGHLAATLNDMTDRLRAYYKDLEAKVNERTQELQATVNRDDALLSSIGDGVIATDSKGVVVLFNKASEEMTGIGRKYAIGKAYDDIWTLETEKGEPVPADSRPMNQALSRRMPVNDSNYYYARKENGEIKARFPVASTVSLVVLEGTIIGAISVFRDITREKQVDRMKTEFLSLASHQLRTPLSAIKWFTEMLINGDAGKLTSEQVELAQNVSTSTERMISLVNSLLNISRIESGRIIVDPRPTDLNELVGNIVRDIRVRSDQRKQSLVVSVHKDLPKINLDPHLIGEVYLNLLTNAIKYTPEGGEIAVFVSRNGDEVVSQVTDNGYGIPKAEQGKLFAKFFRATNITKVETDGTGLGLYLVKAIIESSGGKIWFQSEEGRGTTFWFSIPMSGMKPQQGEVTLGS